jgi:hypothetical protein
MVDVRTARRRLEERDVTPAAPTEAEDDCGAPAPMNVAIDEAWEVPLVRQDM